MPVISCTDLQCLVAITADVASAGSRRAVRDERLRWLAADVVDAFCRNKRRVLGPN